MHVSVLIRVFLARHRWVYWLVAFALAGAVGLMVHAELRNVDAARAAWGETTSVLVADDDRAAGDLPSVERRDLPKALVPTAALQSLPAGTTLRQRVTAGEVLTSTDITAAAGPVEAPQSSRLSSELSTRSHGAPSSVPGSVSRQKASCSPSRERWCRSPMRSCSSQSIRPTLRWSPLRLRPASRRFCSCPDREPGPVNWPVTPRCSRASQQRGSPA